MANSPGHSASVPIRRRLEGLIVFRVVLVTLLLGGAIAVDIESLANFGEFKTTSLLGLIVGTYGLAIGFSIWLRRGSDFALQARLQILSDVIVVSLLVQLTGGLDSLYAFLFHVTIISAAVIVGRQGAITIATVAAVALVFSAGVELHWVEIPGITSNNWSMKDTAFRTVVNVAAVFLVSVLSGYLSDRLGAAQTELEEHREDYEELRALNQNILSSMSSGVLTVDPSGVIIFFNRAAERITGLTVDAVLGSEVDKIFPLIAEGLNPEGEALTRAEATFDHSNGTELYLGFSISPLLDSDRMPAGLIVIFQDLTAIRGMESQVRRSERLAAVGELSAAIAHEIRNPLASISGAIEMLQPSDDSEEDEMLRKIVLREVDRLDHLISDFLDYSRPHDLQLEEFDVGAVVDEVQKLVCSDKDVSISVEHEDLDSIVIADAEATRQILWNLLRNALEACEAPQIEISLARESEFMIVSIEDSGPGIPAELHERVFQPFFTTKKGGTGLGLATTFRLAEEQGGTVRLMDSSTLGGARFDFVLRGAPQ